MDTVYVVYVDWRDRMYEPEIIGVYEDYQMAHNACNEREAELVADGYEADEEFRVWVEDKMLIRKK